MAGRRRVVRAEVVSSRLPIVAGISVITWRPVAAVVIGEIGPHRKIATEIATRIGIAPGIGIAPCRRVEPRIIGEGVGHERNGGIPGRREGVIDGLIAARIARV